MISKETIGETISVSVTGVIEYKLIEAIIEDGVELVRKNWRTTYTPLTDVREFPEGSRLRRVMEAVFTPTLKEEWRQRIAEEEDNARDSDSSSKANDPETLAAGTSVTPQA